MAAEDRNATELSQLKSRSTDGTVSPSPTTITRMKVMFLTKMKQILCHYATVAGALRLDQSHFQT
jgi:hypothetical protein